MVVEGWTKEKDITANKVFLSGPLIIDGRLHATDKLCLSGDFIVTDKLECEGNFTLSGSVRLWYILAISFLYLAWLFMSWLSLGEM